MNLIAVNTTNKTVKKKISKIFEISPMRYFVLLICVLSIAACGGRNVVTKDNSAEYKSARALPPLKKPSQSSTPIYNPPAPAVAAEVSQPSIDDGLDQVNERSEEIISPIAEPEATLSNVDENVVDTAAAQLETDVQNQADTNLASNLQTEIISPNKSIARLSINADAEPAWQFLQGKLVQSDLTVHARNKKAGRFSIGCSGIEAGEGVIKSGRWSIFTRKAEKQSDYCALLATSSRETTTVRVLDRSGVEASAESANTIFVRLLNQ